MPKEKKEESSPIKDLLDSEAGRELKQMIKSEIGFLCDPESIQGETITERGLSLEANKLAMRVMGRIWNEIIVLEKPKGRVDKNEYGVGI